MTLSRSEFKDLFYSGFRANGNALLPFCTEAIADRFFTLTEEMLRVNAVMNLTAITDPKEIIIKHYADCAAAVPFLPEGARLADIGTGAGFPALPFAILRPDITVLAVDSTKKKLDYVAGAAALLGLSNLSVCSSRAEVLGTDPVYREAFDVVCARAVARMNVLAEWCLPLVKRGGFFLAMKGKNAEEEHTEALHALNVLGGVTERLIPFTLKDLPSAEGDIPAPDNGSDANSRCLILVKKRQFTPKQYPRSNAQISKKPL